MLRRPPKTFKLIWEIYLKKNWKFVWSFWNFLNFGAYMEKESIFIDENEGTIVVIMTIYHKLSFSLEYWLKSHKFAWDITIF